MGIENLGTYNIKLDFMDRSITGIPTNINYKNDDRLTSKVVIRLVNNGEMIDLTDTSVIIKTESSTGYVNADNVMIKDVKKGIIEYTFNQGSLSKGLSFFEIIITDSNGLIKSSPKVAYNVVGSIEDVGITNETNYPVLLTLISDIQVIKYEESLRQTNEDDRKILKASMEVLKSELILLETKLNSLNVSMSEDETTMRSNEVLRQNLKDNLEILKIELNELKNSLTAFGSTANSNEDTRKANEIVRELLSSQLETLKIYLETLKGDLDLLKSDITSLNTTIMNNEITRQSNEEIRKNLKDQMVILKSNMETLQINISSLEVTVENNESIRKINEVERQSLKTQMETLKTYLETLKTTLDSLNTTLNADESVRRSQELTRQIQEIARQQSIANIQSIFNALAPTSSTNAEVQLARTDIKGVTHASIKVRLDMMESNPNIIWETSEG